MFLGENAVVVADDDRGHDRQVEQERGRCSRGRRRRLRDPGDDLFLLTLLF